MPTARTSSPAPSASGWPENKRGTKGVSADGMGRMQNISRSRRRFDLIGRFLPPAAVVLLSMPAAGGDIREAVTGGRLAVGGDRAVVWTASSGWKIGHAAAAPTAVVESVAIAAARNEAEAAQLIIRPTAPMTGFTIVCSDLQGPGGSIVPAACVDVLRVRYVEVVHPTDASAVPGPWPDPLPPLREPIALTADQNHPFWIRVRVPRDAAAGMHHGVLRLRADGWSCEVPLHVEVFDFTLPDRPTCVSAFGLSHGTVFRYHGLRTDAERREVLEKYLDNFAAHRISPYNPAPLDPIVVRWPDVKAPPPPYADWVGAVIVTNESHTGRGSLLIFDDRRDQTPSVQWRHLIPVPSHGFRLRFHYRTAVPNHAFIVSFNHHDASNRWMSGRNNDIVVYGNGRWQRFERDVTNFPPGAVSVTFTLRATEWRDDGSLTGLVWFDDLEILDRATGSNVVAGGGFEPTVERPPLAPPERLKAQLDFTAWDRAMERALDQRHFTSFMVHLPGIGGGTYESIAEPVLLGFRESDPEYEPLFASYAGALAAHLREKGWLDRAYVYWFDEPEPRQYEFVRRGFEKIRKYAPGLRGMLTEQVEPELVGGPHIWCPLTPHFDSAAAAERRRHGEQFWWYVCCAPKAPYATLFIDHPGTELRVWLWQTWQRGIDGILVWQTTYWTSPMAYPDRDRPQNPYEDPMGWVSGGGAPGTKKPWGNGDGRFLYPPEAAADGRAAAPVLDGPVDSIRWEMLRDGIEDYEYLAELRRRIERAESGANPARVAELRSLLEVPDEITTDLTHFTRDPAPIERRRREIARAIESLRDL